MPEDEFKDMVNDIERQIDAMDELLENAKANRRKFESAGRTMIAVRADDLVDMMDGLILGVETGKSNTEFLVKVIRQIDTLSPDELSDELK